MTIFGENIVAILSLIFGTTAAFVAGVSILLMQLNRRKLSIYDEQEKLVALSAMRESYERRMDDLAKQLTATPERWKEVNHLVLSAQDHNSYPPGEKVEMSQFLKSYGIGPMQTIVDQSLVFVLTPFSEEERHTFQVIKSVCDQFSLRCIRGDEERVGTDILTHIVQSIVKAKIIIANVSSRNANVYYELGLAHALSKPTILISQTINEVPFDLSGRQILIFKNDDDLRQQLIRALINIRFTADPKSKN